MLPAGFHEEVRCIHRSIRDVEGWLTHREIEFLALLAACPTAPGVILELGSYRGKSTIALASGARLSRRGNVVSCDPQGGDHLQRNLQAAGVDRWVEIHRCFSHSLVARWNRPIGFLWHDGANTYDEVSQDCAGLFPHLHDGAIVAFHDVLNPSGERIRVFLERVLDSANFGPVGLCGSIGWGQYRSDPTATVVHAEARRRLRRRLAPLVVHHRADAAELRGFARLRYKLLRSLVPHGPVDPEQWLRQVARVIDTPAGHGLEGPPSPGQ